MNVQPLISVVIPHFNRSRLLLATIESVSCQTLKAWQIVIVDDGSDADELTRVMALRSDTVLVLERKDGQRGPSRCRNIGANAASGEYLLFLDSDDIMAPWCLSTRISRVASVADLDFAVFPVGLFSSVPGDMKQLWNSLEGDNDLTRFLRSDPPWHTSSVIWRKASFLSTGGFNERVFYGDDSDLHTRALLSKLRYQKVFDTIPDILVRRSDSPRITNQLSEQLLSSRMIRLEEGSKALQGCENPDWVRDWQGQYMAEAEFLLFNVPQSRNKQQCVMDEWSRQWNPRTFHTVVARSYLWIAERTRNQGYLLLRIARRIAKLLLPSAFFPSSTGFQKAVLPEPLRSQFETLCEQWALQACVSSEESAAQSRSGKT